MKKMKFGKKTVYSILTTIGLVGFATPIAYNVTKNNNFNIVNTKTINRQDVSTSSTNTTTNTNNTVDTSNADVYNNEFLSDLNSYKNVDYTKTISKLNNGSNVVDTITDTQQSYDGDLTNNSILATQKDKGELYNEQKNLASNWISSLKNAYNTYKNDWYTQLENEFNATLKDFSDDFYITSINTREQFQSSSNTIGTSTDSSWANGNESISPNSSQNLIGQNSFTFQIKPKDTSTGGTGGYWINNGGGHYETETTLIGYGEIGGPIPYTENVWVNAPNDYVIQDNVNITNTNYVFDSANNLLVNPLNKPTTINTTTNNGDFVTYQKSNNTYNYYRGSLNWGLQKAPIYQINPDTLQLQINTGDGNGFVDVVNSDGTIDTNSQGYKDLLLSNSNVQSDNYYIGDPVNDSDISTWDGEMIVQPSQYSSFSDYYQQRVNAEQQMLDFYSKNSQLQEFIKNINANGNGQNYNISNNNVTVDSAIPVFGNDNAFSITKVTIPSSVEINSDTFNVSQDAFGDNGGLIPKNTSIVFNNFLPILENQIVIDPQENSEPTYDNPNDAQGVYNVANGIKFKLSENMGKLLSITNLYDKYYNQVNAINPSSYKNQSGLQDALTTFKDLFMKFAFRENNEKAISDILTKLQSTKTINQDLVDEINNLDGNPNYVLGDDSNNTTTDNDTSSSNTLTYQDNVNEVIELICNIFNVNNTNYIYNTDVSNSSYFNDNVRDVLALLPTAVKDAMSNNIEADIDYGDGNIEKNQPIWDASKQQFVTYNLNNTKVSDEMAANNESEVSFSNIRFVDKNANTQDALYNAIDTKDSYNGMDFANNGINSDLNYMLDEYKQYYPSENSITVNGGTITYKIKYNPQYSDWQQSTIDANYNEGIPITPMQDGNGYLATDYTTQDYSKYTTDETAREKLTNIITSIGNFFANEKIQPAINLNNTTNDLTVLNNNYTGVYANVLNQLKNSYKLDFSGDNDTGDFYVLAKIENSQNFPNPTGDNGVVIPNKIWYVATNNTNPQIKYYLIKMNAAKKTFNLSNIIFDISADANSNPTNIKWEINNTDNYYYTNTTSNSSQIYIQNGKPTQTQTINIDSNTYLAIQNNITNNSVEYYLFKSKISQWFSKYYNVNIVSMDIVANNGNIVLNLKLT